MATKNVISNKSSELTIDPGASGDSFIQFDINATGEFRIGVDDTDDSFRISQGSSLGTNDTFVVSAAGEITKPLQPAFLVILTSNKNNVTGDGTTYTISWDSEIYDQGGDFASNIFTAPITAKYKFEGSVLIGGLTSSDTNGAFLFISSTRIYRCQQDFYNQRNASSEMSAYHTVYELMDAADTMTMKIRVDGSAKVSDVLSSGATDPETWFSGNLEV